MARISPRSVQALSVGVALAAVFGAMILPKNLQQRLRFFTVDQAVSSEAPLGERIVVSGKVLETSRGTHVALVPNGRTRPKLEIHLASSNAVFGKDLNVLFEGVLSKPGVLENATGVLKNPTPLRAELDQQEKPRLSMRLR